MTKYKTHIVVSKEVHEYLSELKSLNPTMSFDEIIRRKFKIEK